MPLFKRKKKRREYDNVGQENLARRGDETQAASQALYRGQGTLVPNPNLIPDSLMTAPEPFFFINYRPFDFEYKELDKLVKTFTNWINDTLCNRRIVIRDFFADLWDGRVMLEMIEELTKCGPLLSKHEMILLNDSGRTMKLKKLVEVADLILPSNLMRRWSFKELYMFNPVALLHLCVALAFHSKDGPELPINVEVGVISGRMTKVGVQKVHQFKEYVTWTEDAEEYGFYREDNADAGACNNDEFYSDPQDVLVSVVDKAYFAGTEKHLAADMLAWLNSHLATVSKQVKDLEELSTGVALIYFACLQGGYFITLDRFFRSSPLTADQKRHNLELSFSLLADDGVPRLSQDQCSTISMANGEERPLLYFLSMLKEHFEVQSKAEQTSQTSQSSDATYDLPPPPPPEEMPLGSPGY